MICLGRSITIDEAVKIGMVDRVASDYSDLIETALMMVKELKRTGGPKPIADGPVNIPPIELPGQHFTGDTPLSREATAIAVRTIGDGAKAADFNTALEIGYQGFADIACTDAAREGITAFLEKREPQFTK
jgi:enoyl-CoA hydratase/3-hydroxyacyl-CoA dehydrogenase